MDWETLAQDLTLKNDAKIVLLVLDGLGDLPENGLTPLEKASTPNLDRLAKESVCGLTDPVSMGITPGSGPAHLSLFGYDPLEYILGRGILEALGLGVEVKDKDLVARGNFATLKDGQVVDRRAGRISTEINARLCDKINPNLPKGSSLKISLFPGKEHRFVVRFRGKGLSQHLSDADPQKDNKPPVPTRPLRPEAKETANLVNEFIEQVTKLLKEEAKATTILLRGFSQYPSIPSMNTLYKITPAAIAHYPMYRGLAKLVGMDILDVKAETKEIFTTLEKHYAQYDFFFLHYKKTDAAGEDGNFRAKVKAIEEIDPFIPRLVALKPEVLVVTSDHSTPCQLKSHSWHPNPFLLRASSAMKDKVNRLSERECSQGHLGRFTSLRAIPLMLAHSGKLKKFGA